MNFVWEKWELGMDDHAVFTFHSAEYACDGDSSVEGHVWRVLWKFNGLGCGFAKCYLVHSHAFHV